MPIDNILTILDKPKHGSTALNKAAELQARSGCRVELCSFAWHALGDAKTSLDTDETTAIRSALEDRALSWHQAQLETSGIDPSRRKLRSVWTGDIADWVAKRAAKNAFDLVVKTIHNSKTLLHTPLDWQLLRECQTPMLFTTSRKPRRKKGTAPTVLAALDLRNRDPRHTSLNRRVLAQANELATLMDATLHCVTAIEVSQPLKDLDIINPTTVRKRMVAGFQDYLEDLIEPYNVPKSRIHFPIGKVGQVVTHQARLLQSDLLVVGTLAHKAKQRFGIGNSAEKIISRSPVDLLAVPPA